MFGNEFLRSHFSFSDEKVDIIISEWMGFYLLHESMLNSVISARDNFLTDDGSLFPSEARIYACPCSLSSLYKEQLDYWDNVHGFNMSAVGNAMLEAKSKKPEVCIVKPDELLAEPAVIKTFDLRWTTLEDVSNFSDNVFVNITKNGSYHGICLWFDCDFDGRDYDEDGNQFGELITLSTSPFAAATHWKQTVVVLGKANMLDSSESMEDMTGRQEVTGK